VTQPVVPTFSFDTSSEPAHRRFALWREVMAATHEVSTDAADFTAQISLWSLDRLLISHGRITGQSFVRTREMIRRDHLDHFGLFVQAEGTRASQTDTTDVVVRPGDVLVFDLSQPMSSRATDGSSGTLYLPRAMAEDIAPGLAREHGQVLRTATARMLAHHVYALGHDLSEVPGSAMSHLADATRELALACIAEHHTGESGGITPQHARKRTITQFVEANLSRPDLDAGHICAELGFSRTALYRMFRGNGGIHGFIKQRRLQRVRSILLHGSDPRTIGEIALDHGFASDSHFNREFREFFGQTPGSIRGRHGEPDVSGLDGRAGIDRMFRQITG
jgi:AraC-like DNA-binding protein